VWQKIALLAVLGAVGTLCRYGLGLWVQERTGSGFPWGTVVINLLGCLAFGIVWSALGERRTMPEEIRTIILVGFMGAFTTYSTYMFELAEQLRGKEWLAASGYFALHNLCGWIMMSLGIFLGKWV
jgi:CrcB protein